MTVYRNTIDDCKSFLSNWFGIKNLRNFDWCMNRGYYISNNDPNAKGYKIDIILMKNKQFCITVNKK